MSISLLLFLVLSVILTGAALGVLLSRNAIYSALSLIVAFFAIAGHYLLLDAQFLAAVHVIVYAGAIMVLFLYMIMMLNLDHSAERKRKKIFTLIAAASSGIFLLVLTALLRQTEIKATLEFNTAEIGLVEVLGKVLFSEFLLPFELSALLFLAAMVGAVYLSKKELSQ